MAAEPALAVVLTALALEPYPGPFLINLPLVPLNRTKLPSVAETGPTTAPSILVCATVQSASAVAVPDLTHIIKSPISQTMPA